MLNANTLMQLHIQVSLVSATSVNSQTHLLQREYILFSAVILKYSVLEREELVLMVPSPKR